MARKNMYREQTCSTEGSQNFISQEQLNEKIREVAQRLYEKRGRVPLHALDDWLEAEKIVKKRCEIEKSTKC